MLPCVWRKSLILVITAFNRLRSSLFNMAGDDHQEND